MKNSKYYRQRVREQLINAYGGICACCSEPESRFLTIDHIYNDGSAERKTIDHTGYGLYYRLKREGFPRDRYQLLCMNCNFGKSKNGGVCPHLSPICEFEAPIDRELEEDRYEEAAYYCLDPRY